MASVPYPPATREQLTTLIAKCFGEQPTSVAPLSTSDPLTDARWQDAVTHVGEQLRTKLRVAVLPDRLHKALALVLAHAVTLHPDGTASVQSGKQTYSLEPECSCADATHRTELCKHTLAVELHRRALAVLDGMEQASTAAAVADPVDLEPGSCVEAPPVAMPSTSAPDSSEERLPSADRWNVNEAPASCCLRLRVGELELMYTMRDVSDAELTGRVQHLVPWAQDLLDQARERQAMLDTLRQQRANASASSSSLDMRASTGIQERIDQAVQQALAAHQVTSNGITPTNGHASEDAQAPGQPPRANTSTRYCAIHGVAMEQRSNARGSWWSHWIADEQRYCKGKAL